MEPTVLSQALRGNSRLRRLTLEIGSDDWGLPEIANGLSKNKGLEYLCLPGWSAFSDDSMDNLCQALQTHPTLATLVFPVFNSSGAALSRQVKKQRICMLEDLLTSNTVLHTIDPCYRWNVIDVIDQAQGMCDNSIQFLLTMNRYRPRFKALGRDDLLFRPKLLGPALAKVSGDLNLIKMLLTVHADVVCASATTPDTGGPTMDGGIV